MSPDEYENPVMSGFHPSDYLINSEEVAENTFENDEGERVVDLGDGFLNMDRGYGMRHMGYDEFEELSRFLDVPNGYGRPRFVLEDGGLYIEKGSDRVSVQDPDINFRYVFPEMMDIAGGTTLPPEEQEDEETSLKKKILTAGVAGSLVLAGAGGFLAWDYSGDGLSNHEQMPLIGGVEGSWMEYDSSGDGLNDGEAHGLGLNPAESYPAVAAAYRGGLGEDALEFQGLEVEQEDLEEVARYISEIDDPEYVGDVVNYLAREPDHIPALINQSGEVSNLAFEYMMEFKPDVLEILGEYALDEISKELVQGIEGMETTQQRDYIDAVSYDGGLSELAVRYLEDLEAEVLKEISGLEMNRSTEMFAEELADLPGELSQELAGAYASDGFTVDHAEQACFLNLLEEEGELEDFLNKYEPTNKDVSGDGLTNYFSLTQSELIDVENENNRFAIHFNSYSRVDNHARNFVETMGIPEENVWIELGENATYERFGEVLSEIGDRVTDGDMVFASFRGHGVGEPYPHFSFVDKSVIYEDFADDFHGLQGEAENVYLKLLFDACYSGAAIPYMEGEDRFVMTSTDDNNMALAGVFPRHIMDINTRRKHRVVLRDQRFEVPDYRFNVTVVPEERISIPAARAYDTLYSLTREPYDGLPDDFVESLYENVTDASAERPFQVFDSGVGEELVFGDVRKPEDFDDFHELKHGTPEDHDGFVDRWSEIFSLSLPL